MSSLVKKSLVYWGRVNAAAGAGATVDYAEQFGPAALSGGMAASIYTITMAAGAQVDILNRMVVLTPLGNAGTHVGYDHAASADATVVVNGWTAAGAAGNSAFYFEIWRVEKT